MKKFIIIFLAAVLLCGCAGKPNVVTPPETTQQTETAQPETTGIPETTGTDDPQPTQPTVNVNLKSQCIHSSLYGYNYDRSYHYIDGMLINYVGRDRYDEWVIEKKSEPGVEMNTERCNCHVTIYDFVKDFDIPREVFEALNDNILRDRHDYNAEAIYTSREAAEEYYTSDRGERLLEIEMLRRLKEQLIIRAKSSDDGAWEKWIERKNETEWGFSDVTRAHFEIPNYYYEYSDEFFGSCSQCSYAELIKEFNIQRDFVESAAKFIAQAIELNSPDDYGDNKVILDLDRLYSDIESDSFMKADDGKNIDPYILDHKYVVYIAPNAMPGGYGIHNTCMHVSYGETTDYEHSYHSISGLLISYVGDDRMDSWTEVNRVMPNVPKELSMECCNTYFTIYNFVKDFNIPREVFEALNDNFLRDGHDYNLDVIYASEEEAEAYYKSDRREKTFVNERIHWIKGKLGLYVKSIDSNAEKEWIARKNETEWGFSDATRSHILITNIYGTFQYSDEFVGSYAQFSFTEYIKEFNIPKDVVEKIVNDLFGKSNLTIDVDRLYSELDSETLFKTPDGKNIDPFVVDEQFIVKK